MAVIELFPTNYPEPSNARGAEYNPTMDDPSQNPTWPPQLADYGWLTATMESQSWASRSPHLSPYVQPAPEEIFISELEWQVMFFLFDTSAITNAREIVTAQLKLDFNQGGSAWIDAYEIKSVGQEPAASNVRSFSGDWIVAEDVADVEAEIMSTAATPLEGTAFQAEDFFGWFSTPYWDVDNDDQGLDLGPHYIDLALPVAYVSERDWIGIKLSFDQPATYFLASFDTQTPDGIFWQVYGDGAYMSLNPVAGVSLILEYTDEDDPRPLPDIAISATARLGIDGPLLRVGGLAESPVERPILAHAARARRGW